MTSVKHFPGLGRVRGNTDFSSGVVDNVTVRGDADLAAVRRRDQGRRRHGDDLDGHLHQDRSRNRAVFSPTVIQGMLRGDLRWTAVS